MNRPLRKILVANRGEIARRIMRSARHLGLRTVAVYSSADAGSLHVREADQAICIGGARPSESYLDIATLIGAAQRCGADAVHPGYGFLAENEDFAAACREAGLVFIGPSPEAIRAMGNKALAKQLMQQAGVPCIPGYQGEDQSDETLFEQAGRVGYPVMIKATAGGGGRGMRLVQRPEEFLPLLQSARSEAQAAFGNAEVLLERAIALPRHVEIQVFADRHGNVIHLGERDCSVQRRHQKLVEEAPSPAVDEALRQRMGETAVTAARAIGYEGAGTFEFLLDREGRYYFMEMNTRLQVEHPVTEAVCEVDLVEWQFRVAAGETLPLRQDQVRWKGHAIEVRLCAEDAARDFMPQSGTLAAWRPPEGLRVEHALHDGAEIAPYYDSMVAKLVAHGNDREEARRRLVHGVEHLVALGVVTNRDFLLRCLEHPVFAQGDATTAFIGAHAEALGSPEPALRDRLAAAAAVLLSIGGMENGPQALASALPTRLHVELDGHACTMGVLRQSPRAYRVAIGEHVREVDLLEIDAPWARMAFDGITERLAFARAGEVLHMSLAGESLWVRDRTLTLTSASTAGRSSGLVRANTSGRVVALHVEPGQPVQAGQAVVTLEAMKMEHLHLAAIDGALASLLVAEGDQVQAGQLLAEVHVPASAS